MPRLSLQSALGTAILLISPLALALGFGPTRTQTTLGQHLDFSASVMLEADETVPRDCVSAVVHAGDFQVAPRNVRAVLEATRGGSERIVRVTTAVAIDEPIVTVEVSIGCGSRVSRRFVAFIDPPTLRLAEAGTSETVALPSQHIDSQTASLADIARQADASRRRGGSDSARGDSDRPSRNARRATRAPVATVASATPAPPARARRQAAAPRPAAPRPRTALAAPPRVTGARLRLDPPRAVATLPTPPTPAATIALAAPTPAPASAPLAIALASPDPLMAQLAAAAAAAAGASSPAASAEQDGSRRSKPR